MTTRRQPTPEQQKAARAAVSRINRALNAAEELKGAYDDLVGADPRFADDWRLRSAGVDGHISFLRSALDWAERAARGEWER